MAKKRSSADGVVALAAMIALGAVTACRDPEPEEQAPRPIAAVDLEQAGAQVRGVFEAIERSDCGALAQTVSEIRSQEQCEEFLRRSDEQGVRLLDVREVVRDGRDPRSAIVRAVIERRGRAKQVQIRATFAEGRWNVAL